MVMIIFNLIEFYNVKVSLFSCFFDPFVFFAWFLMIGLFFVVCCLFYLYIFSPLFFCWGNLVYFFGCDLISYGLILLSLWICVLTILAREAVFRSDYFSGFFVFVVVVFEVT
jgi:NADH-ubiquinone oxidoreductase chain 4